MVKLIPDFLKGKKAPPEFKKQEAVMDMADLLMDYGFTPDKAVKTAKDFWKKHNGKLKDVI